MEEQPEVSELEIMEIKRHNEFCTYGMQWTIFNYYLLKPGKFHTMHSILIGNRTCRFQLCKNQTNDCGEPQQHTDLILALTPSAPRSRSHFCILGTNNRDIHPVSTVFPELLVNDGTLAHYIEVSDLFVNDTLTVKVSMVGYAKALHRISIFESIEKPSLALGNLLQSGQFADLDIIVGEKTFKAHRAILSARSTVLEVMFDNNLQENFKKTFRIDDADEEAVGEMLNYIYTGETKDLNLDLASNLFRLADQYDMPGLRFKVASYLMDVMSIDHAMRTLVLADMHSHEDLKDCTIEFIAKKLSTAMQHKDWAFFRKHHDELFQKVLESVADICNIQYNQLRINSSDSE